MVTSPVDSRASIAIDRNIDAPSTPAENTGNKPVASTQVRGSDGQTIGVTASIQAKTDSSHNELAARIERPSNSRESEGIFARLKALFTGGSRAESSATPAEPTAIEKLAADITEKFQSENPHLATKSENLKTRAETHIAPAAEKAIAKLVGDDRSELKQAAAARAQGVIENFKTRVDTNPDDIKGNGKASKALSKNIQHEVIAAFKDAAAADGITLSKSDIKHLKSDFQKEMKAFTADSLNKTEANWQVTEQKIVLTVDAQKNLGAADNGNLHDITFTSKDTPAGQLPVLKQSYAADGNAGYSSMSTSETRHAVNLSLSEFKGEVTSYAAARHAVNFPFGIKNDPDAAAKGADNRTNETITMVASSQAEKMAEWMEKHPNEPYPLKIVSTSLLTAASKAKNYELGQQAAWERAQGQRTVQVDIPGKGITEVEVNVEVLPFSIGVNGFAKLGIFSSFIGKHIGNFLTGWKWADNHNRPLFEKLDGMAHEAQAQALKDGDDGKALRIQDYRNQLSEAVSDGKQRRSAGNAYGVAELIHLISAEVGAGGAINCMSGKDRTGYLDASIKERLMEVESLNAGQDKKDLTPQIYGERTVAQNAGLTITTEVGGGKTVQERCTGAPGYKVGEGGIFKVKANLENVLDSKSLLGHSGAVKA